MFVTFTYDDAHLPSTLSKLHLSAAFKRLRSKLRRQSRKARASARRRRLPAPPWRSFRFFACGEYGEKFLRPHYHAILFGLSAQDASTIESSWGLGFVHCDIVNEAVIAYVAGYCSKKIGYRLLTEERIDYTTGEVYTWVPPFIAMSKRPGIGGEARSLVSPWRDHAIYNGLKISVPRFLHQAWLLNATPQEILTLQQEKLSKPRQDTSRARLKAAEAIASTQHQLTSLQRGKL